ncbi:MAG: hypothetical protein LCH31_04705 [Actinobacteria bacterium]|nr:hypothetical protein [Actinomycetota bacterium]
MKMPVLAKFRTPVRRNLTAAIAATVIGALVIVAAPSPAFAQSAQTLENKDSLVQMQAPGFTVVPDSVPAVESLLGKGSELSNDLTSRVALGASAANQTSVLVRVTALAPAHDQTIATGEQASPVLFAPAGRTVSTVILLPVSQGSISLWSAEPGAIRVEPLAYFGGSTVSPGATHAVQTPVRRANTQSGLAGNSLTQSPLWFGLIGEGGVPSRDVRSAYVTLDMTLQKAGGLSLSDGQTFDLPSGRSVITTVVTVDDRGGVAAQLTGAAEEAPLTADVLGWVTEAPLDATRANLAGSYVANTSTEDALQVALRRGVPSSPLRLTDSLDSDYALVLISGTPATSVATTVQASTVAGRADGAAVDPVLGTTPQLALVPVSDALGTLAVRQGSVDLAVLPLGGFLGDAQRERHDNPTISVTSHQNNAHVDISDTGYFTLEGSVSQGANSVDRVELSAGADGREDFVGTAQLSYGDDAVSWSFDAAAPDDGTYTYTVSLFDRGDRSRAIATQTVTLHVDTAEDHEPVVTPEARVLNMGTDDFTIDPEDERRAIFQSNPGLSPDEILVGGAASATPEGFLGRITAINFVGGVWVVDTVEAKIEELIFQSDIDEVIEYENGEGTDGKPVIVTDAADTVADQTELFSGSYAVADEEGNYGETTELDQVEPAPEGGGQEAASLLTGNAVNLDLAAEDFDPEHRPDVSIACTSLANDPQEPRGEDIADDGTWSPPQLPRVSEDCGGPLRGINIKRTWSVGTDATLLLQLKNGKLLVQDQSKMTEDQKKAEKERAFGNKFGVAVKASGEASATLTFQLDVKFHFTFKKSKKMIEVKNFKVQIDTEVKARAGLSIYAEVNWALDLTKKLGEVQLPSVTFLIGVVPVVVLNDFEIGVSVNAGIRAKADIPVIGVSREDTFGFTYSTAKGFERIKHAGETKYANSFVKALDSDTKVTLAGWVSVGPEITFNSRIYKFAGPAMTLDAGAGVRAELKIPLDDTSPITATVTLFLGYGLNGKAKLTLLSWELLNITIFKLEWETELWSGTWVVKSA